MNDLNMFHAQNADLKSRVSDSGLSCDSTATAPDRKDIEAFELAMRQDKQSHSDDFNRNADTLAMWDLPKTEATIQAPLSTLFSMVSTFNDVQAPVRVDAPQAILSEDDLNMLVERILVSAANDGTQEVRLILNESVLSGTEIVLNRNLSGQLVVALHCKDESTFQTLVGAQFELKNRLEVHEVGSVHVSVDIHQEGNDARQRSRGYFEYASEQLWKRDNA